MNLKTVSIMLLTFLVLSCTKKDNLVNLQQENIVTSTNSSTEKKQNTSPEILENNVITKQSEENMDYDRNFDDSIFDDEVTQNFSLLNSNGVTLCLYHNIRKISEFDDLKKEKAEYWSANNNFYISNIQNVNVKWSYRNGVILALLTQSNEWSTKRGIKVGDNLGDAFEKYAPDSIVKEFDPEENKYVVTSHPENSTFLTIYDPEKGMTVNAGNMVAEEMMCMQFYAENGIITKIEIFISH